jgi:hypothetical protein
MRGFAAPWWICGGWALDLFVGRETRRHDDLDVAVLRRDQAELRSHLRAWELRYATDRHTLEAWDGGWLDPPIHGIWARRAGHPRQAWACEFLLNEASEDVWVYRRDERVRRPLSTIGATRDGIPHLRPEIALLYKANDPSPKNDTDFSVAHERLPDQAVGWLRDALETSNPAHPWIDQLRRRPQARRDVPR